MVTIEQLKTEIEKINKGCGKEFKPFMKFIGNCGDKDALGIISLCPSCQSKKQGLIQGAKMMKDEIIEEVLEIINKMDFSDYCHKCKSFYCFSQEHIHQRFIDLKDLFKPISELKQLNNWLEKEDE